MSTASSGVDHARRAPFVMIDADGVHEDWWRDGLSEVVGGVSMLDWLRAGSRCRARLFGQLLERLSIRLAPVDARSTLGRLLAMDGGDFERILKRIGLGWNGALMAREIDRTVVRHAVESVGEAAYRRSVGGYAVWGRPAPDHEDGAVALERMCEDGIFCLRLWAARNDQDGIRQLLLRLPPENPDLDGIEDDVARRAAALVEREVQADD
ncbi:MAG: hypothetical protein H6851_01465 [Geminicoccaceae bacterium]|nr:hypothetical protein [Geminicoccaceae bacterium]MCB9942278.1 hypothetical protein [Geminicoccaceae bacterium]